MTEIEQNADVSTCSNDSNPKDNLSEVIKPKRMVITVMSSGEQKLGFVQTNSESTLKELRSTIDSQSQLNLDKTMAQTFLQEGAPISEEQEASEKCDDQFPEMKIIYKEKKEEEKGEDGEKIDQEIKDDVKFVKFETRTKILCNGKEITENQIVISEDEEAHQLKKQLRSITRHNIFQREKCEFKPSILLNQWTALKKDTKSIEKIRGLKTVVDQVNSEFKVIQEAYEEMKKEKKVCFDMLMFLFSEGSKIVYQTDTGLVGAKVNSVRFEQGWCSRYFVVDAEVVDTNGKEFITKNKSFTQFEFDGVVEFTELTIRPITEQEEVKLTERGRKFSEWGLGATQLAQQGSVMRKSWCRTFHWKADGRCMTDTYTFGRMDPNYSQSQNEEDGKKMEKIPEDMMQQCACTIKGFSFHAKKWGELAVENLCEIKQDVTAFNQLVLDEERKSLIRSLVENYCGAFTDIISGKSGGCIFLLHGPPGTGKTLTAEAIAELLKRPLQSVSVGELGTTVEKLEEKLREILEVAHLWNAVILLDEADIFLEKRSDNDIHRNAMVGIFLRLLEYHQGVLFLTTNRVKAFDDAFHSRVSVALEQQALGEQARTQVWRNLLEAAGLDTSCEEVNISVDELSQSNINGRQIKNVIRLAQTVAKATNQPITTESIFKVIDVTTQFKTNRI